MSILFLTGAGISANAGIATYRDTGSSWTNSDLEKKSHVSRYGNHLDELWNEHWGPLEKAMNAAEPTYTHKAIAEFQRNNDCIIATQNIDNLHEMAGSDNVLHLHGNMIAKCMKCNGTDVLSWFVAKDGAPNCLTCGSRRTRPDVVLFGEMLDMKSFNAVATWTRTEATHVVSIGTSLNVFPAASLVLDNVNKAIIINKELTGFSKFASMNYTLDCDTVIDEVLADLTKD